MPVVMTHKNSASSAYNLYKLQFMNLYTTQKYLEHFKETDHFQKNENSSNTKKIKCYNYDIKEHYTQDCCKLKKSQHLITIKEELRDTKQ